MTTKQSLGRRVLPLAIFGLGVGFIRLALEFVAPERAMWFGIYYAMPVAFLVVGLAGMWGRVRWLTVFGTMAVVALIVWGLGNTIAYTVAQFEGWGHGRFYHGGPEDPDNRAMPVAATTFGKIGSGLAMGGLTSIAGTVWCTVFGTLLIWLPARMRNQD